MHSGYVTAIDTEKLGLACVELGAGRTASDQSVDPWAGIEMAVKLNHSVDQGQPLVYIYGKTALQKQAAARLIYEAIDIQSEPATSWPLIAKVI
jgi:pyrimidine-nucleoside phosphorylase